MQESCMQFQRNPITTNRILLAGILCIWFVNLTFFKFYRKFQTLFFPFFCARHSMCLDSSGASFLCRPWAKWYSQPHLPLGIGHSTKKMCHILHWPWDWEDRFGNLDHSSRSIFLCWTLLNFYIHFHLMQLSLGYGRIRFVGYFDLPNHSCDSRVHRWKVEKMGQRIYAMHFVLHEMLLLVFGAIFTIFE